jgi:hypothetical protein
MLLEVEFFRRMRKKGLRSLFSFALIGFFGYLS